MHPRRPGFKVRISGFGPDKELRFRRSYIPVLRSSEGAVLSAPYSLRWENSKSCMAVIPMGPSSDCIAVRTCVRQGPPVKQFPPQGSSRRCRVRPLAPPWWSGVMPVDIDINDIDAETVDGFQQPQQFPRPIRNWYSKCDQIRHLTFVENAPGETWVDICTTDDHYDV